MNARAKRIAKPIALAVMVLALFAACDIFILFDFLDNSTDLTIELTWDNSSTDLDLYVTHPDVRTINPAAVPLYDSVTDAYDEEIVGNTGFFPKDKLTSSTSRNAIWRNDTAGGPTNDEIRFSTSSSLGDTREVIDIYDIPFTYDKPLSYPVDFNSSSADGPNGLPSGYDFAWVGVMEVYVWSPSGTVSGAGNARVIVYDSNDNALGEFPVPEDTTVEGASLVRIPVFRADDGSTRRNYYQILAHTQLLTSSTQIRSITGESETIEDYSVNGAFGRE
jgi:hypothetical protein